MDIKKYENFSKAGKDSMKKYLYLLDTKPKKNIFYDELLFLDKKNDNDSEDNESYFFHEDIFNKTYEKKVGIDNKKISDKLLKVTSACSSLDKKKNTMNQFSEVREDIMNNRFNLKFDKYKYHLLHHNDNYENLFNKSTYSPSCAKYQPKFEYTYRKLIYSIPFKKMSGRQNTKRINKFITKNDKNRKDKLINDVSINNRLTSSFDIFSNNKIRKINKKKIMNLKSKKNELIPKRQNKVIDSYNSINISNFVFTNNELNTIRKRIKFENQYLENKKNMLSKSTNIKSHNKINSFLNKESEKEKEKKFTNPPIQSHLESFNSFSKKNGINESNDALITSKSQDKTNHDFRTIYITPDENINQTVYAKKNILNQTSKFKGINFKQMLSREYLNKINSNKEPIHPAVTPNYSAVEPKTIMKVIYSKSKKDENKKQIIAYKGDFTYDINNIYNNYNNHHYPKKFNLSKMCGRFEKENNALPLFMIRSFDRNSIDNLNEISLKMNNYANRAFQDIQSTFSPKKTFNARLKLNDIKKENQIMEYNKKYYKKNSNIKIRYTDEKKDKSILNVIPKNSWLKNKLGEFYKKDYDNLGHDLASSFIGSRVDGVTFKLYENKSKYKDLLTKREKEIFSPF